MKQYLLFCFSTILILVLNGYVCAQTPKEWVWTSQTKGESSAINSQSIATDAAGNTYVLGNLHYGKAVFGRDSITSPDHDFVFIAKYNAAGALLWAKEAGLSISGGRFYEYIMGIDLALDTDGNIYITGIFSSAITIGGNRLISGGSGDIFVAKFSPTGSVLWALKAGGTGDDYGVSIALDAADNVYITGNFSGTASFGNISVATDHSQDAFVAKLDKQGNAIWARKAGGTGTDFGTAIAVDAAGNSWVSGQYQGSASFDGFSISSVAPNGKYMFVARYDANGTISWVKRIGGASALESTGIVLDAAGNCYVTGTFTGSVAFDGFSLSSTKPEQFLTKYDEEGHAAWAVKSVDFSLAGAQWGGDYWNETNGVAADADGNIYITGSFDTSLTFGESVIFNSTGLDVYVARFNTDGSLVWVISGGGSMGYEWSSSIALDLAGDAVISGYFMGSPFFGGQNIASADAYQVFVTKLGTFSVLPTIITQAADQTVFCAGTDFSVSFTTSGSFRSENTFTVQFSDASGSFAHPVIIGTGSESPIMATIPVATPAGAAYRVRVVSSAPAVTGSDNGADLQIEQIPDSPSASSASSCEAGSLVLTAAGATATQHYRWYTTASGGSAISNQTGSSYTTPILSSTTTYYVSVVSPVGCESKRTPVTAAVSTPPAIAAATLNSCFSGDTVQDFAPFTAQFTNTTAGASSFLWEFGDGTSSTEAAPSHTYSKVGTYEVYLTVYFGANCLLRQSIERIALTEERRLPNVFTPNGDEKNKFFAPRVSCLPTALKVYNRWGKLVYEHAEYQNNWDGEGMPDGVYFYQLTTISGQSWNGWVQIIRAGNRSM